MTARRKTHWLRTTLIVLAACCVAGLVLTAALSVRHPEPARAVATVQFGFDGAAGGIAPNGEALSIRDICSDPVLSEGLAGASLENAYTPAQLRPSLAVLGRYPGGIAGRVMNYASAQNHDAIRETGIKNYTPVAFDIALYDHFDPSIPQAKLEELLQSILNAYRARFILTCSNGPQPEILPFDPEECDYPHGLEILRSHYLAVSRYARSLYDSYPSFRLDGVGFDDISARLTALADGDILRLEADLFANGLSRDGARLLKQYDDEVRALTHRLEVKQTQLQDLDGLIGAYDKAGDLYISTSRATTRIDGNSSKTYDALVQRRGIVSGDIARLSVRLGESRIRLAGLQESLSAPAGDAAAGDGPNAEKQTALPDMELADIAERGDAIVAGFGEMLEACNLQQLNEQALAISPVTYQAPKLLSVAFVKRAVRTTGPLCALGFMVCMALIIVSRKRKPKA